LRDEGTALRFLEIRGVWEDHVRYAITNEDWNARKEEIEAAFLR
jgi:ribosomal-protein-alanine N-acetyltransferase